MKRIITVFLGISLLLCSGCTSSERPIIVESYPNPSSEVEMRAEAYFFSTLPRSPQGGYIYPDTYGGIYADGDKIIILVASDDFSEYQYLCEKYSYVELKRVEYSWNYLQGLAEEYMSTYDKSSETVYMAGVDVMKNRAVIKIDKESFARKTQDENSPIIFEVGNGWEPLS